MAQPWKLLGIFRMICEEKKFMGGGNSIFFLFSPPFGEDVHPF